VLIINFPLGHYGLILAYADLIISPATGMTKDNEYRKALIIFVKIMIFY